MDADHEQRLAEAFADLLDRQASGATAHPPELAPELAALSEIDRVLEPAAPLPDRLSGHKIIGEIGAGGMGRVLLAMDEALSRKVALIDPARRSSNLSAVALLVYRAVKRFRELSDASEA